MGMGIMMNIVETRDIPLDDLVVGKGQARTQDTGKEIEDLARSIEALGLLQPILVCTAAKSEGKWEILAGQRRFLAHQWLKRNGRLDSDVIAAVVLDEGVQDHDAKAISITENLIRRNLSAKELTDGITELYNHYGTVSAVVETTGLPRSKVRDYVKAARLAPDLKDLVREGKVDVNVALKAQDASSDADGNPDTELAIKLAREMAPMSGAQRKRVVKEIGEHPDRPVEDAIEAAKTGAKVVQIVATVTQDTHTALRQFARQEGGTQDEAAVTLIEEALAGRGLLGE